MTAQLRRRGGAGDGGAGRGMKPASMPPTLPHSIVAGRNSTLKVVDGQECRGGQTAICECMLACVVFESASEACRRHEKDEEEEEEEEKKEEQEEEHDLDEDEEKQKEEEQEEEKEGKDAEKEAEVSKLVQAVISENMTDLTQVCHAMACVVKCAREHGCFHSILQVGEDRHVA